MSSNKLLSVRLLLAAQRLVALLLAALLLASCGARSDELRVSAIPDMNKTLVAETTGALCAYLEERVGVPVRFVPSNDYTAAVNGLLANKLDLVWYGGVTSVEVESAAEGAAEFVATRDIDLKFKSYFIANERALADGKVQVVESLEELEPLLSGLTMTFGDKKSTSGHIMPRHFLVEAGIDPEQGPGAAGRVPRQRRPQRHAAGCRVGRGRPRRAELPDLREGRRRAEAEGADRLHDPRVRRLRLGGARPAR